MRVPVRHIWTIVVVAFVVAVGGSAVAQAQTEHAATTQANAPPGAQVTHPPAEGAHQAADAAARQHLAATAVGAEHDQAAAEHGDSLMATIARLFNFALLAGTLFYLLRSPLAVYLTNRSTQIRERLVRAGDMRTGAASEQAAIARKMQSLPAELEALRKAGAEEVAAEEARIRQAAESERERLLEVTRREISVQLRLAERSLMKQAADLAVAVASERVRTTITDADHIRLVDRYLVQVGK